MDGHPPSTFDSAMIPDAIMATTAPTSEPAWVMATTRPRAVIGVHWAIKQCIAGNVTPCKKQAETKKLISEHREAGGRSSAQVLVVSVAFAADHSTARALRMYADPTIVCYSPVAIY